MELWLLMKIKYHRDHFSVLKVLLRSVWPRSWLSYCWVFITFHCLHSWCRHSSDQSLSLYWVVLFLKSWKSVGYFFFFFFFGGIFLRVSLLQETLKINLLWNIEDGQLKIFETFKIKNHLPLSGKGLDWPLSAVTFSAEGLHCGQFASTAILILLTLLPILRLVALLLIMFIGF